MHLGKRAQRGFKIDLGIDVDEEAGKVLAPVFQPNDRMRTIGEKCADIRLHRADKVARNSNVLGRLVALEDRLAQPMPPAEIAEAGKRLKQLNDELEALEERWLTLSEELEAITAEA